MTYYSIKIRPSKLEIRLNLERKLDKAFLASKRYL